MPVLLTSNHADFYLKNDLVFNTELHQFFGLGQILLHRQRRAVKHMGAEEISLAPGSSFSGLLDQRQHKAVHVLRVAMVGVQGHVDIVVLGNLVGICCKCCRTDGHGIYPLAGGKAAASGGDLDYAVRVGFLKGQQRRINGLA